MGIPEPDRRGRTGFVLSALIHLLIFLILFLPALVAQQLLQPETQGAGGPGPAGGGGGGTGGTGGAAVKPERLQYIQVAPISRPLTPAVLPPPVVPPKAVVPPPVEQKPAPPVQAQPTAPVTGPAVAAPGSGGGSGNDGSSGNGPGSGGGIGSGVGTGRGSGAGSGTGGGPGTVYPPTVTNLAILPIPVPGKVRPYKLIAYFDVDERGNATLISFNPSKDGNYNKKIREMLAEVRFRPAVRWDGTAVRDTAWITAEAP